MDIKTLLKEIRSCTYCADHLPLGPGPIITAAADARLMIVGQAPGTRVHETGIPWNDASGDRLRHWLDMDRDTFYSDERIAIVPMGFCYPGRGSGGDLPPRPECAPLWRDKVHAQLPKVTLKLLIGQYAQAYYLGKQMKPTLTATVQAYEEYLPLGLLPLVHPSPRNQIWFKKNPWFDAETVPAVREHVRALLLSDK